MNRLDLLNYGPYINKAHFLDPQSPKAALNNSHDHYECGSPSNRKSLMMRRSILLPNGITLEKQIESIFSKQERTRTEAKLLYEAIKDFPFIKMLCNPIGDKNPLDYESIIHLIRSMKFLKVQPGDIIYNQEDPSDGKLYILYSGEIALLVKDPDLVTARNYERFETEQKKRTIVRLGSFNKDRDQRQKNARSHTPNVMERVNEEEEGEGEPNDHVFQLLKSYMTSNFIPQKKVKVEEAHESDEHKQHVEKDLARVSGITRAVVKFKKVLKQKNDILNVAKSYGIVRDRLEIGQYFGGSVMLEIKKREETAFAMNDCELLVISYKDLQLIKAIYSKKRIALRNFMFDSFPKLELYQSEKVVTGLLGTLEEKLFEANAQIVTEGQSGEYFYILQSGTCEISKEIIIDEGHVLDTVLPQSRSLLRVKPSTKKRVPLTTISQGVFFGDELIFHAQKYCYTVKVTSSKATVVAIKNKTFAARFPQVVFETMKNLYQNKCQNYLDIIKNLISSAQYENYELDSDLNLSYSEKKAALEKIDMKDLSAPLKLRTKNKKIPSSLYKSESNSARQTASAFGQRTSAPLSPLTARETKDVKDSTGTKDYQLKTPQQEKNQNGIYNFEEQAKIQPVTVTEKGVKPGHRPKNRSLGQPVTNKHSRGISQGGAGQNLQTLTPLHDEQAKDEELERVRELIRARTAINADVEGIRGGMLKKDHISYINSHRITNKGLIDMKMLEDAESKGLTTRRETPTIENLKLEIDIDKASRRKFLIQNMQSQSKSAADTPKSSARRDDKDSSEELKSPRDVILPGIKDGEYKSSPFRKLKNRLKLEIGANEKKFRGNEMSNPASASQSHRAKDYAMTVSTPTLVRNQSFSTANTPFGKETNVFDIEIPKNINKYIAQKQHLKLKEKLFAGDLDESEIFGCNNIPSLPRTPTLHAKREASLDLSRDKPLSSERSVRGTSAASMYRSYKPSGMSNFEKQAGETRRAEEKKDAVPMKKVEVGIVWKDKQSIMLKQKGKMYKQLTKKGEIKGIFPTLDAAPDFNRPLKSAKAMY